MAETGKVVAKQTISAEAGGQTVKNARAWIRTQVPYKNFAGMDEALDQQAAAFVAARREQFRASMSGPMQRWAINWSAANSEVTWQEREDDVHMPETKKALEGKVARIEEAVTSFDPVFEVEGTRGDVSRRTAKVIGSYVYRQMELAEWKRFVQPVAKDGELCNVMAMKVQWDRRIENSIERNDHLKADKSGNPRYVTERRMKKSVVKNGVSLRLIDPFWFIYDLQADSPQECSYIGDESEPFLHELEQQAELGVYSKRQLQKVRDVSDGNNSERPSDDTGRADWPDTLRRSRSIATNNDFTRDVRSQHGAHRVRLVEMWALYDFGAGVDGVTSPTGEKLTGVHRVVITTANGVVIRLQENPFDRKFVPYAFEMVNRTGHELAAPAPFDAVVQSNAIYDRLSSNIARWMDLAVSPLVVTSDVNTDLPDSILDVQAGSVMRNTGQWDWVKVPDITSAISYQQQFHRREIEELSGNLRVFESPQGTATATERKVQEQQRMVRSSVRANGNFWRQVALLVKNLEAQFSTGSSRFKVSGKASQLLGEWASVTPQMLQEDVDFRFLGLTDVHVFGNRLQGMAQWMNRWGPMLPQMPEINMNALVRMDFELSVGRSQVNEIFPDQPPTWEAWSQDEENAILLSGQEVEVHPSDDDNAHMEKMVPLMKRLAEQKAPKFIIDNAMKHWKAHMEALVRKEEETKAQMANAQRTAQLMAPQGGAPGVDRPPAAGGMQASDVTPGSPQARTQSRTGRDGSGLSQTDMM